MENLIGQTLGRYVIRRELGRGGMATVFLAYQPDMEREVAIKVLPREFMHDRTFLERFQREAKAIARLNHPHILPVHDYGEDQGWVYIVMAYMDGGSLADRIHQAGDTISLHEVARIVEQVADALDYAHSQGVIHRDLKPANVLMDQRGNAYLTDFGIAKMAESTAHLTGSGVIGTPAYMAPEMSLPGGPTPLVDIYALGVMLYQMVTGRLPYEADTPMGAMMAHVAQPIPDARILQPNLPDKVQRIIERAMAKEPSERYQAALELAADLEAVVVAESRREPIPPTDVSTMEVSLTPPVVEEGAVAVPRLPSEAPPPRADEPVRRVGGLPWVLVVGGLGGLLLVCAVSIGVLALSGILGGREESSQSAQLTTAAVTAHQAQTLPVTVAPSEETPTLSFSQTAPPIPTTTPESTSRPIRTPQPIEVNPYCDMFDESPIYVNEGQPVTLVWTWVATQPNLVQDHIDTAIYEIYLDGHRIDAQRMGEIAYIAENDWYTVSWYADVGTLSPGEHLAERHLSWSRQISDGWDTFGPGGEIEAEHHTCTIVVR